MPDIDDADVAELIDRGRAALKAHHEKLPPLERPIGGGSMSIVLREDFIQNVEALLEYVVLRRTPLYVLYKDGHLAAVLSGMNWRL